MSRQRRSHQKQRAMVASNVTMLRTLDRVRAERNRTRIAGMADMRIRETGMPLPHNVSEYVPSTAGIKPIKRILAPDDNLTAASLRNADMRYVVYQAVGNVYASRHDTDSLASQLPCFPIATFAVSEYGNSAQSMAWSMYREMTSGAVVHAVGVIRLHESESAERITQHEMRVQMSARLTLTPAQHRKMAVAYAEHTATMDACESDARHWFHCSRYSTAQVTEQLTDGITDGEYREE